MITQKQTIFLLITLCFTSFSYSSQQHLSFRDALLANAPTHRQALLEKQKNLMKILEDLENRGKKEGREFHSIMQELRRTNNNINCLQ